MENKAVIETLQLAIKCIPHTLQYLSAAFYDERKIEATDLSDLEGDL